MLEIPPHPLPPNETKNSESSNPLPPNESKRDVMCPDQKSELLVPKNAEVFLIHWGGRGRGKIELVDSLGGRGRWGQKRRENYF